MPRLLSSPDRLFDRTWRPGHPFRPRLSRVRRLAMIALLLLLNTIIGGYWYITDATRVRAMAQGYLSELIGGRVVIGGASLSIFQGLRLNDVRVYVDDANSPTATNNARGRGEEGTLLFRAQALLVRVDPRELLHGRLDATQIVAVEPYVQLAEDLETGRWNYQRLRSRVSQPSIPQQPGRGPMQLPELLLRNAIIETVQLNHGVVEKRGNMAIEGQLKPSLERDVYLFNLQSRGATQGMGPSVTGRLDMTGPEPVVTSSLMNFRFGPDLETMLPAQVRKWWRDHDLTGRVDVPELTVRATNPPPGGASPPFRAELALRGVDLKGNPEEWFTADEMRRQEWARGALLAMRAAGLDSRGFVSEIEDATQSTPINLHQVTGTFVFTEDRVEIQNVSGFVESNGLKIRGHINNYATPSKATASIRVSSLETDDILIPASPRYVNSMPAVVKEIYDHLRPQGRCRFWVQLDRPAPNAQPELTGEISILDGQFVFDEFPYPIVGASGRLVIGKNTATGEEQLEIIDIRGHGSETSRNRDARIKINGLVSPFGAETGVRITIVGEDVLSEPLLFHAFPIPTQRALRLFDAPGKGEFPIFRGGFTCEVERKRGLRKPWEVSTHIRLDDASGSLAVFPYPMTGVSGEMDVYEDHVRIAHMLMKRDDGASLQINGDVSWSDPERIRRARERALASERVALNTPRDPEEEQLPPLRPDLKVLASNVPIDDKLLGAMPESQREWLKKLGVAGKFDLDGRVGVGLGQPAPASRDAGKPSSAKPHDADEIGFDFRIAVHDGSLWPSGGMFAASGVKGDLRLVPGKVTIDSLAGKRGDADLSAHGSVNWGDIPGQTQITLSADAKNLLLDSGLYNIIPQAAKGGWDQVRPTGTLDAAFTYNGAIGKGEGEDAPPESSTFQLSLTPRKLSVWPVAVPYKLEDVSGSVLVQPDKVTISDLTARHGGASVKLAAVGSFSAGSEGAAATRQAATSTSTWDFKVTGDNVMVDDDFRTAVPAALSEVIKSLQLKGKIGFAFDKLIVKSTASGTTGSPTTTTTSQPASDTPSDVDFAVKLTLADASLDVGVPLGAVQGGRAQFVGATRAGKMQQLQGAVDIGSLTLAGLPANDFRVSLLKQPDRDVLRIQKLEAKIADGELAGQFDCAIGESGPTRYAAALVLRNADVRPLTAEAAPDLRGRLSASLAIEGAFGDTSTRRGRGDVSVTGQSMYRIPLLLGLLQITNLSLPITSPFNEATSRYSVDGNRVTFENIELRARDMLMQGNGHLDFATKQVRLSFVTESTTWPKLPIISDILQGARHELLQIYVKGTIQDPKVSAGAFGTVTTTVDEVLRGGNDAGETGHKK